MLLIGVVLLAASSCATPGPVAGPSSAANPQAAANPQTAATTQAAANTQNTATQAAVTLPEARFTHPDYYAMPGQKITFDASPSLPGGVSIAQYEWDFNGDGVVDEVGSLAVTAHIYDAVFEGNVQVRITHFAGGSSTASAGVHIGRSPNAGRPAAPVNVSVVVIADADGISTVQISWESSGEEPYRWGITIDGIPAGLVEGKERTATVKEVHRVRAVKIGVVGFTEDKAMGESASLTLPAG
jgi:hypothetical protein